MKNYTQELSSESFDALRHLLASKIQNVLSPDCSIAAGSSIITVSSLSIPIGQGRFAIFENDWGDTPAEYIDYFCLSVRIDLAPLAIYFEPNPAPKGFNYKSDHLSLSLGTQTQVAKIEVLSAIEIGSEETVKYDAGLLITRNDGLRLAIVREKSIAGFLQIAHTDSDIAMLTTDLKIRNSLVFQRV